ncbi:hypothetical protein [Pseudomonas typographi]|uniref:Uncharacterized protein n=1 Tax=Pseudomonas typographi TaxID=2715964 RepID=A0ABR7Z6T0_9PSED|nr:hypothetical protein [Pseudomonas typographi]MBD1601152.1 hypothetical protein [Pseudomonas typographi]
MTLAQRLLLLWQALQRPETTFADVVALAQACDLNPGVVLRNHFQIQRDIALASLEA